MPAKTGLLDQLRLERPPEEIPTPRRRSLPILIAAAVILALLAVALGARAYLQPRVETAFAEPLRARAGGRDVVLEGTGYVAARRRATVSSKITGRLKAVYVDEGMRVEQGQLLAELDGELLENQVLLAEAQLATSESEITELEIRLAQAERMLSRQEQLFVENVISAQNVEDARTEVESRRSSLDVARKRIRTARVALDLQRGQAADMRILAPFSGVVVSKNAQLGEMISPVSAGGGFTRTGICTLVDMTSLEIEVDVAESNINRVLPGLPVVATLDAYPDWQIPGRVITTVPAAERSRATVKVRIAFDELGDPRLLPDMGVRVRFLQENGSASIAAVSPVVNGVSIPASALHDNDGVPFVLRLRADRVERQEVSIARRAGDRVEISSGLEVGAEIVVSSSRALADGTRVRKPAASIAQ